MLIYLEQLPSFF